MICRSLTLKRNEMKNVEREINQTNKFFLDFPENTTKKTQVESVQLKMTPLSLTQRVNARSCSVDEAILYANSPYYYFT